MALKAETRQEASAQAIRQPLLEQIKELEQKLSSAARLDSMLRAARKAAGKSDGQVQVLTLL